MAMKPEELPRPLQQLIRRQPRLWKAYEALGRECTDAGPLDHKTVHLVKLALYAARGQQTPFQTHVRAALKAGASVEEVEHALLQLLTAEGLGTVVRALKWAGEVRKKR